MNKKTLSLAGLFILFSQVCIAGELIYSVKEYAKHGYVTLDLEKNMDETARDYSRSFTSSDKNGSSYELLGLCFLAMAKEQKETPFEVSRFSFRLKYPKCSVFDSFK
ncbi:MAG: hypothetical protein ACOYBW_08360 [Fluviibacter phosphoraccumulans]|jgi:hypothetical protein|uniref:hypothetical protein n=1 Tax=Fluviibacter phosphoraccumulans TaxID=1751046 RepID=UPI0024E1985E|nr:hypothetical protein [Fluviibacter phosphoraccumulans]